MHVCTKLLRKTIHIVILYYIILLYILYYIEIAGKKYIYILEKILRFKTIFQANNSWQTIFSQK